MQEPKKKRTGQANKGKKAATKKQRRLEAELRDAEYAQLTIEQKIAKLDAKLGIGQGAKKQRQKICTCNPPTPPEPVTTDGKEDNSPKQ
jgi:hypothetical protein